MSVITVKRANVVLDISPDEKQFYMEQGFSVIDAGGNVVEQALSSDVNELKILVTKLRAENEALKAKNEELSDDVAELKSKLQAKPKKSEKAKEG